MIAESHIQAIARFVIGFGTEQDDVWRDYNLDFCGNVHYDASGAPVGFDPVGNSGYSLGSLQWDFGQGPTLAGPFIEGFETWIAANPKATPLASDAEFATRAVALTGNVLRAKPALGLHRQDVQALSEYVRSDGGSDWVNQFVDQNLIGSDQQPRVMVLGQALGASLVAIGRQLEATKAFAAYLAQNKTDVTDLILAIGMKAFNQSPGTYKSKLLPFLAGTPTADSISTWYQQFGKSTGLNSGVGAATNLSLFWSKWRVDNPGALQTEMTAEMTANCLANPCRISKADGAFVLAKQVFENSGRFGNFTKAFAAGKDFVDKSLFDKKTGKILVNPKTSRLMPGVLIAKGVPYAWDAAGNAFQRNNNAWTSTPVAQIQI